MPGIPPMNKKRYTYDEWVQEAQARFGADPLDVAFKCPLCGHVATARDYEDAGTPWGGVGISCIGRWTSFRPGIDPPPTMRQVAEGGPCDYTGRGLVRLNPVEVEFPNGKTVAVFDFAEKEGKNKRGRGT